jgi:hypothetical protein
VPVKKLLPVVLALAAIATFLSLYPASGQTTTTTTTTEPTAIETSLIFPFQVVPSNGFAAITDFGGADDGLLGVECTGNNPQGGSAVPAIVLSRLDAHQITLRIASWGSGTPAVNGKAVIVNCAIDAFWLQPQMAQRAARVRAALNR